MHAILHCFTVMQSGGVPINRISKILAANMVKFEVPEIGFYEIVQIQLSTDIFICTNNLMQCLIVTIMCCVDDQFTSLFCC